MKIFFFAPHSAIWVHAFPEALVAEALVHAGHEVMYVTCGEQLKPWCVAMSANGLRADAPLAEKNRVCRECEAHKRIIRREFRFAGQDLSEILTDHERQRARALVNGLTRENFLELTIDGVPVGRVALYEFLLENKKSDLEFDGEQEWNRYLRAVESALYALLAAKLLFEREQPDSLFVYNSLYSANRVVCLLAAARGISVYFLHAGGNLHNRLETLMLARSDVFRMLHGAIGHWEKYRNRPLESEDARWVTNHVLELLKGRSVFVYSVPRAGGGAQLRVRFGINAEQKVLCAALSSYDERFSAETVGARPPVPDLLFPRQVDWAKALIEYVSPRPDLFLILRVHPREFPNKRETVHSSHARELRTVLAHLPANVAVNWPTDGLSLYDLADITDVFLNAWSSVGKEMALLGLPVVIYSLELPLYPADINHVGVTLESYLRQIDQALSEGWRYETLRQAYRWCAVEYRRMLIDISESYTEPAKAQVGLATRVARRAMRALVPHWQQVRDCRRRQPLRARETISRLVSSGSDSILDLPESTVAVRAVDEERERSILRGEIRHLLQVMYPDVGSGRSESKLHNRLEEFARG